MVISLPDDDRFYKQVPTKDLPPNWRSIAAYSSLQKIGSDWITAQETLVLKVPSAVISVEYNYIVNTEHPEFKSGIKLVYTEPYF